MNNASKIVVGVLAAAVLLFAGAHFFGKTAALVTTDQPNSGSVSSADIYSPYLSVNGLTRWFFRQKLATATTTPCSLKTPAATTTLSFSDVDITTATSTATTWTVAYATTAFATTTILAPNQSLGSGAQGTLLTIASSSPNTPTLIPPSSWVVWGVAGIGNLTSTKLLGTCQAVLQQI